ncbi:MAG TPA: hypothetical protein VF042_07835 [Gemmatimonadaceae bacterium]
MIRMRQVPLLVLAMSACTSSETITSPEMSVPVAREARVVSTVNYSGVDLGTLPGDEESIAWSVNDAGTVAVQSTDLPSTGGRVGRWYVQTGTVRTMLNAAIRALSGGYVVGYTDGSGQRWTYSVAGGFSAAAALAVSPRNVNDLGDAVGETADGAGIVQLDGTVITVPNPDPSLYAFTEARDINNPGDIVISYLDSYSPTPDRGYLRMADGTMIEFNPLAGHNSTYVRGVSQRIDGKIYVAGMSDDDNGKYNAVRWTVDVATHAITATEVGSAGTYSVAMTDDGTVVGVIAGSNTSAFVWKRGGSITSLKTPKGLSSGRPWGVSGNGKYIAGDGVKGSYHHAILWTAQ